jgi:hypothetical protein
MYLVRSEAKGRATHFNWLSEFESRSDAVKRFRALRDSGEYGWVTLDAGRNVWVAEPIVVWSAGTGAIYRNTHA